MDSHESHRSTKAKFRKLLGERLSAWKQCITVPCEVDGINLFGNIFDNASDHVDFPCQLSSWQRKEVHNVAAELGLSHASFGQNRARYIRVSKVQTLVAEENLSTDNIIKPIVDYQYFHLSEDDMIRNKLELEGIGLSFSSDVGSWMSRLEEDIRLALSENSHADLSSCLGVSCESDRNRVYCLQINTAVTLNAMVKVLLQCRICAFDMEMHSYRTYLGMTCLLQMACHAVPRDICIEYFGSDMLSLATDVSGNDQSSLDFDFLIDTLAIPWGVIRSELSPIFANPSIVKVCHGAKGGDIPALYRDFGIVLVNGFDTLEACRLMGFSRPGLAHVLMLLNAPGSLAGGSEALLVEGETGGDIDFATTKESLGSADWRQRPLPDRMVKYARMDVRFLIPLYYLCLRRLYEMGSREHENGLLLSMPPSSTPSPSISLSEPRAEGGAETEIGRLSIDAQELCEVTVLTGKSECRQTGEERELVVCADSSSEDSSGGGVWVDSFESTIAGAMEATTDEEQYAAMWEQWGEDVGGKAEADDVDMTTMPKSLQHCSEAMTHSFLSSHCLKYIVEVYSLTHMAASSSLWTPPVDPRLTPADHNHGEANQCLHPYATPGVSSSLLGRKISGFKVRRKSKKWSELATFVTKRLLLWRERVAISVDESPSFVCPSSLLLDIAEMTANCPSECHPLTMTDLMQLQNPLPSLLCNRSHQAHRIDGYCEKVADHGILQAITDAVVEYAIYKQIEEERKKNATLSSTSKENKEIESGEPRAAAVQIRSPFPFWSTLLFPVGFSPGLAFPTVTLLAIGSIYVVSNIITKWKS